MSVIFIISAQVLCLDDSLAKGYGDSNGGGYGAAGGGAKTDGMQDGYQAQFAQEVQQKVQQKWDPNNKPLCSEEEVLVAKLPLNIESNGKRAANIHSRTVELLEEQKISPDEWLPHFHKCVPYHYDLGMAVCGMKQDKVEDLYSKCMEDLCAVEAKRHPDKVKPCQKIMEQLVNGPKFMTKLVHKKTQEQYCDCVHQDKMHEKHSAILRHFYKRFAPQSIGKVPGLMEKYSTKGNAQFALLMFSLHSKYKDSFNVHDPTAEELFEEEQKTKGMRNQMQGQAEQSVHSLRKVFTFNDENNKPSSVELSASLTQENTDKAGTAKMKKGPVTMDEL